MFGLHFISKYKACNVGSSSVKLDMLEIIATSLSGGRGGKESYYGWERESKEYSIIGITFLI
jgi:hypothetical protein